MDLYNDVFEKEKKKQGAIFFFSMQAKNSALHLK
jgi:hypothetical protein